MTLVIQFIDHSLHFFWWFVFQKPSWSYDETSVENSSGYYDKICGAGNLYAYTRGNVKELTIRKPDDQDYFKKLKVPYGLMHFQFDENGTKLIALGSNSEMNSQYKQVNIDNKHNNWFFNNLFS